MRKAGRYPRYLDLVPSSTGLRRLRWPKSSLRTTSWNRLAMTVTCRTHVRQAMRFTSDASLD